MEQPLDRRLSDAPSDEDVIARVLNGEKQQFEHLVGRYQQALYRHAVSIVLDHDAAADMVQDAFVRAYLSLRECRDRARFKRLAVPDAAQSLPRLPEGSQPPERPARRRRGRRSTRPTARRRRRSATKCGPGSRARWRSCRRALREAFVMHYVDGVPYETMAELLDASVSALKMRALRAREALSTALRDGNVTGESSVSSIYQAR